MSAPSTSNSQNEIDALLPALPQKIIFCIDVSNDMTGEISSVLCGGAEDTFLEPTSRIEVVKRLILRFINLKLLANPNHEFAVILLAERAIWHMNFTNDKLLLQAAIEEIGLLGSFGSFDMDSLLQTILNQVDISSAKHFIQAIAIYGRSSCIPSEPSKELLSQLQWCTSFVFDMLYIHEKKSETNCPQDIYNRWLLLESDVYSGWFFDFGRLARRRIALAMMQLLAHPLQRTEQEDMETEELKDITTQEDTLILLDDDD
ncbi:hypothetical protein BGW37DRAFT_522224 [Umbelopsis sp. PMI_123]|nr:hypothetical protein BGW37DRAFT_522224 [Umbelopsis sp. PMI_123]